MLLSQIFTGIETGDVTMSFSIEMRGASLSARWGEVSPWLIVAEFNSSVKGFLRA